MICNEYLIDYTMVSTTVKPVGTVRIYFSKKLLEQNYFNYLENSHIIPAYTKNDGHGYKEAKIYCKQPITTS